MGGLGSKSSSSLEERLQNAQATGRLRLLRGENFELVLAKPELKNLKAIDLSNCHLSELPKPIGNNITKLQQLKLNDNPELAGLPLEIFTLKDLRKLDCGNCRALGWLERLPDNVEHLVLSGCGFQGMVEHPTLSLSPNLIYLDLSRNSKLEGFGKAFGFEVMRHRLVELNLSDNPNLQDLPQEIQLLAKLLILKLENCPKITTLPSGLFTHTEVSRIELRGTGLTKQQFLQLDSVQLFMDRRKARLDREIAGGLTKVDTSVCGLD
ncbi:hypothetical protein BASA81_001534 [Batrachochytrium salamandrivorans]|nr:hypothetical protein BASA81_001534 [Batrachochytrium salamandrivorans]